MLRWSLFYESVPQFLGGKTFHHGDEQTDIVGLVDLRADAVLSKPKIIPTGQMFGSWKTLSAEVFVGLFTCTSGSDTPSNSEDTPMETCTST